MQNDVNNAYLRKSAQVLEIDVEKLRIVQLSNLLPYLTPSLIYIFHVHLLLIRFLSNLFPLVATCFEELAPFWIVKRVQEVVDLRIASDSVKRMDLLQLMLDASLCEEPPVIITTLFHVGWFMLSLSLWLLDSWQRRFTDALVAFA